MKNFKVAIFDMDGLLLNSERLALDTFLMTCAHFDLGDLSPVFNKMVGANSVLCDSILRDGLLGVVDFDAFSVKWDIEYKRVTEDQPIALMSGVVELLTYIKSLEIPMLVATSDQTLNAKNKLKAAGILNYFVDVIGADQVKFSKPSPEVYLKAASFFDLNPADCIAFEDSANGVRSAVSAGLTVVQIPDLTQPDSDLLALGHVVLGSLMDVITFDFNEGQYEYSLSQFK